MRPDAHDRLVYAASKYLRCVVGCVTIRTSRRRSRLSANSIKSCCAPIEMPHERGARAVIKMRRAQLSFGDGLIANEVEDLREKWMTHADEVLEDEQLVANGLRGSGEAASQEPQSWPASHAGRSGLTPDDPQACS